MRKLLLFDIDGTLVTGGPAKDAFHRALLDTYGTAGDIDGHEFSGKTDPQIARELLDGAGLPANEIDEGLMSLWSRYTANLEVGLVDRPMQSLPGVNQLLETLRTHSDVAMGLVTGNIVKGAELKLGSVRLNDHFELGGFGSDHEFRNELPGIAIRRAEEEWNVHFHGQAVVVVGDTPRDIECGRHVGAETIAVATGNYSAEELVAAGAHQTFESFADVAPVLGALVS